MNKPPHGTPAQTGPTSYLNTPSLHPQPLGGRTARVVEVAAPVQVATPPTITVSRARRVLLTKAIVRALNLQDGQRVDLVPPIRSGRGGRATVWELDTQSRTGSVIRIRDDGKAWLTLVHHVGAEHFHKPRPDTAGQSLATRTLILGAEDPARPGIYFLRPD